jgi:hypothetical protein
MVPTSHRIARPGNSAQSPDIQPERYQAHLLAAIEWIRSAHRAAGSTGISKGYDLVRRRWAPWYPETTGYTIPTLLNAAAILGQPDLENLGLSLADDLLATASPDAAVGHWMNQHAEPIVFDTGQVIFGWLAAYAASQDARFLSMATLAGDWLVSVQDPSGAWKAHQYLSVTKVIDTRVAWALLELWRRTGLAAHRDAAVANLEWALREQAPDGWFHQCAFTPHAAPFTHTLAYVAEGLLESGRLLGERRYIAAAQRTADALLVQQKPDGRLAGTFGPNWRAQSRSSCLTGNCQLARLWLVFFRRDGSERYLQAARQAIAFVASRQNLASANAGIRGAIAGSSPLYGRYERLKYPNWAAKFFVDALLALRQVESGGDELRFVG